MDNNKTQVICVDNDGAAIQNIYDGCIGFNLNTVRGKHLANEYFRLCLKHKTVRFTEVTKENK